MGMSEKAPIFSFPASIWPYPPSSASGSPLDRVTPAKSCQYVIPSYFAGVLCIAVRFEVLFTYLALTFFTAQI